MAAGIICEQNRLLKVEYVAEDRVCCKRPVDLLPLRARLGILDAG